MFGTASDIGGEEKRRALVGLIEKYSPDFLDNGKKYIANSFDKTKIVKVEIDHITGKAST